MKIMYKYFNEDELKCRHTGQCDMDWAFMQTMKKLGNVVVFLLK